MRLKKVRGPSALRVRGGDDGGLGVVVDEGGAGERGTVEGGAGGASGGAERRGDDGRADIPRRKRAVGRFRARRTLERTNRDRL